MTTKTNKASCKKGESCKCKRGIYKVHCIDCGRFLLEAPASTWTWCPDCRRWSRIEPEESHND